MQASQRGAETRERMVLGALRLLAERGVDGTSFRELVEREQAPRGSIYFHFPEGKRQLVVEAIRHAGSMSEAVLRHALREGAGPEELVRAMCAFYRALMEQTRGLAGCPVAAVAYGSRDDAELAGEAAAVFDSWRRLAAGVLVETGTAAAGEADGFAELLIAAVEGALVLSRAERGSGPLDRVEEQLVALVAARRAPR